MVSSCNRTDHANPRSAIVRLILDEGDTLLAALLKYLTNPFLIIKNFLWPLEKIQTLFWSVFSFGLIPLFYLPLLPIIFYQFASRFLDLQHPVRWTLFYHYSAELAVLMAVATIYGVRFILKKAGKNRSILVTLVVWLLTVHFISNLILDSPLKNLAKRQFWQGEAWMRDTRLILSMVPVNASVAAQNNLLPHLSHRQRIYLLPNFGDPQYVVVDLHTGQDNWNFYTGNLETAKIQFKDLILNQGYMPIISGGDAYLLAKQD